MASGPEHVRTVFTMDWDSYTDTGMLNASAGFKSCSHGTIKPTYMIDDGTDRYILHTVSTGEKSRLHTTREIYNQLGDTDVPSPAIEHDGTAGTVPYLVVEAADGENPERTYTDIPADEMASFARQAGQALGQAHRQLPTDISGTLTGTDEGIEIEEIPWDRLLSDHMHSKIEYLRRTAMDDHILDAAADILGSIEEDLDEPDRKGIIHLDYRPGNLMWDGEEVTAVLDWDNARAGDQLYDYVTSEISFIENAPHDRREDVREAFRDGYEHENTMIDEDDRYDIYRYFSILSKAKGLLYVNEEHDAGQREREDRYVELFHRKHERMNEQYRQ